MSDAPSNADKPPESTEASYVSVSNKEKLIPLRIDVASDDGSVRLFDTLLWDPSCWIIPLYYPLEESVERNVQELAHTILSDAEVYGLARTTRHFTGRVDVWSRALQAKVAAQLRPQLWGCLEQPTKKKGMITIRINLTIHGVLVEDEFEWDVSNPHNPPIFDFCRQITCDLKLPEEATNAIAISMLEQIHGIDVPETNETRKSASAQITPQNVQIAELQHLVASHRPTPKH